VFHEFLHPPGGGASPLGEPEDLLASWDLLASFRWVDTVCINQTDNQEKSHQVQMMGEIYQRVLLHRN
jgi:hypothetical protein